jgi:hypothetical protein
VDEIEAKRAHVLETLSGDEQNNSASKNVASAQKFAAANDA